VKLKDKVAIITGANRGLGAAIAHLFAQEGVNLLLVARDGALLKTVAESLPVQPGQKIEWREADVTSPEDITAIGNTALEKFGRVDILVNNAGIYGPIGPFEEVDWAEWLAALNINLLGAISLSRQIVPIMKKQGYGKIINLSGGGATAPLPRFSAYAVSKAALVRFTETIAEELAEFHIDVNAIAPGALNTRLLDQILEAGPQLAGEQMYQRSLKQQQEGGASMEIGAELAVFLASEQSDGISGRLISAIWDDWRNLTEKREKLKKSDVFTLRRIVPEDRGWEVTK